MNDIVKGYLGSPLLKRTGVKHKFTKKQEQEYEKCFRDPQYFIERYVKVITLDRGFVNIDLYPFQKETIRDMHNNRKMILKAGRQVGKTTVVVAYILWYVLFNEDSTVAILANKAKTAREILDRIKMAYEALPKWLQQGIREWNKGNIELENKCRIMADSTASSAIRGYAVSFLYLDEFAFVPNNIAESFFTSVYPTISSGTHSKMLVTSTPNGMNHFYRMWKEATEGIDGVKSGFVSREANWREVPGRTEEWAADQKRVLGEQKYLQEMECTFLGSSGTLISAAVLKSMDFGQSIRKTIEGLDIYEEPIPDHFYVQSVDSARGIGLDYSAFVIVDATSHPYKVVAKYRSNVVSPLLFPSPIVQTAKWYNNAYLLIENNDIGGQVADLITTEFEYENMFHGEESNGKMQLTQMNRAKQNGIKTTKKTKRQGCNALKDLLENYKLEIKDFNIIEELSTFILKKNGYYAAEEGQHDDLVMCLVMFSWLTVQPYFRDITDHDIRKKLFEEKMRQIEEDMPLLGIAPRETPENPKYFRTDNIIWETITPNDDGGVGEPYQDYLSDWGTG